MRGGAGDVHQRGDVKGRGGDESERGGEHLELLTRAHPNDTS